MAGSFRSVIIAVLAFLMSFLCTSSFAQDIDKLSITIDAHNLSIRQILSNVEKGYGVRFFYNAKDLKVDEPRTLELSGASFDEFIKALFQGRAEYTVSMGGVISLRSKLRAVIKEYVKGTVKDENGDPVAGAYVFVRGSVNGTFTDVEGRYRLDAPSNSSIEFSLLGMKDVTVPVNGRSLIDVVMEENMERLDDLVVTALGVKKERKALGYSVTELKSTELFANRNANIVNSLSGKVAGVNVTQTGGAAGAGSAIIIRGGNSASEGRDNQPLFVVDGIIYDNSTANAGGSSTDGVTASSTTFSNRVMDINPEDIESISVLKGAAAAALYGSRAADGVILITTKQGTADGNVKVDFTSRFSYSQASSVPTIQSVYGRGRYNETGLLLTDNVTESWGDAGNGAVYDNVDGFFKESTVWDNSFSISGGYKNGNFYFSASRFSQDGIIPGTGYDKTTARFNGKQRYGNFTLGVNASYSIAGTDKTLTSAGLYGGGGNGTMTALYGWSRSEDMSHWLNDDGSKYLMFPHLPLESQVENPYWIINKNKMTDKNKRITGSATAEYEFTEWLDLSFRLGVDSYINDAETYIAPGASAKLIYQNGRLSISDIRYNYVNTNFMLNFNKTWGDFDVSALIGTSTEDTGYKTEIHWGYNFQVPGTVSFDNIMQDDKFFSRTISRKRLVGVYGELRGSWRNMVYLTLTGRNDWTSTLPVENRSYFYPSVSGSFIFTELLPTNGILTFGKIRGSWAQVGKDSSPYATNTYMWESEKVNGNYVGIGNMWEAGHRYLKPERQSAWEIGAELKFLNGRFGVDYTYYRSETRNQIASPRLSQATGYIMFAMNSGSVRNEGMELMFTGMPVEKEEFSWDVSLNLAGNRGTLGDFVDGIDYFYVTDAQIGAIKAASIPNGGHFLGMTGDRWLRERDSNGNEMSDGRYLVDPNTGLYKMSGSENNVVGNREPDFTGGLANTFRYRNFSLSSLIDFRVGGDMYNGTQYYLTINGQSQLTLNREEVSVNGVNAATGEPFNQTYRRGEAYMIGGVLKSGEYMIQEYWNNYSMNSLSFIQKVNWLKLRNITLSYDFKELLKECSFIKGMEASISADNLFTITNYKGGMDPEVAAVGSAGGSGSTGIDYCGVPTLRTFTFGINLTF